MMFNRIDLQTWNRKDRFNHYFHHVPCTYSMTVNLDITHFMDTVKSNKYKFFPTFLFVLTQIVNRHKEFRMDLDEDKNIGYYDALNPCYTVFHDETETFTDVWTQYTKDLETFLKNYNDDMNQYKNDVHHSKPMNGKNYFDVSCIPWISFTGFNLNLQKEYDYLLPIFTIGKYHLENDQLMLPLALQVHHAVCDGFHISRFINELQDELNTLI